MAFPDYEQMADALNYYIYLRVEIYMHYAQSRSTNHWLIFSDLVKKSEKRPVRMAIQVRNGRIAFSGHAGA